MATAITFPFPFTLGNIAGSGTDGVLAGSMADTNPSTMLLESAAADALGATEDDATYTDVTTAFNEATGDDVELLPAVPAVGDALYAGHATLKFSQVDINITTQGVGTWTITWEYWDGDSWEALSGVTDNTTGFTAATGVKSVSFTVPGDWAKDTVGDQLGYWVRGRVSAYTSVTTQPLAGQGWVVLETSAFTDDTTDFTDAGAGDVDLLGSHPISGDAAYFGHLTEKWCKLKITTSQAMVGTATITWEYWDGDSWESISVIEDDAASWKTAAATLYVHFEPPSDWVANTAGNGPNGTAGFFVRAVVDGGTVTTQPQATQGWVKLLKTGAEGISSPMSGTITQIDMQANTLSATNADSVFLIVNTTTGNFDSFTWTQADPRDQATVSLVASEDDEIAIVQIIEDGTTEFADATMYAQI